MYKRQVLTWPFLVTIRQEVQIQVVTNSVTTSVFSTKSMEMFALSQRWKSGHIFDSWHCCLHAVTEWKEWQKSLAAVRTNKNSPHYDFACSHFNTALLPAAQMQAIVSTSCSSNASHRVYVYVCGAFCWAALHPCISMYLVFYVPEALCPGALYSLRSALLKLCVPELYVLHVLCSWSSVSRSSMFLYTQSFNERFLEYRASET